MPEIDQYWLQNFIPRHLLLEIFHIFCPNVNGNTENSLMDQFLHFGSFESSFQSATYPFACVNTSSVEMKDTKIIVRL
jgi:hypothetical protein